MNDAWKKEIVISGVFLSVAQSWEEVRKEFYFQAAQALKELREECSHRLTAHGVKD
jgi:hypothetical protein